MREPQKAWYIPDREAIRFADFVRDTAERLAVLFNITGPFVCTASIEMTGGVTEVNTGAGPVRVVGVLGGPRTFEIRRADEIRTRSAPIPTDDNMG